MCVKTRVPLNQLGYPHFTTVDCAGVMLKAIRTVDGLFLLMGACHRLSTTTQNMTRDTKKKKRKFKRMVGHTQKMVSTINKSSFKNKFSPTLTSYCKTRFWTLRDLLFRFHEQYEKATNLITNQFEKPYLVSYTKGDLGEVLPIFDELKHQIERLEKCKEPTLQRYIPSLMLLR